MKYFQHIAAVLVTHIALLLFVAPSYSYADTKSSLPCIIPNGIPPQPNVEVWQGVKQYLSGQFEQCLSSSDYFALYGASLLYTGNVAKAIEMLERALLINPQNGSARIDYAQALYQSGQLISAIQVNQGLLKENNLPTEIKSFLQQRDEAWKKRLYYWRSHISYLHGYSSNLNNATYVETYDLTGPWGRDTFPIQSSSRAHSGPYNYYRVTSQYYHLKPQGTSLLSLSLKTRTSNLQESDTDEFSIKYEQENEGISQRTNWGIGLEHLRLGNKGLYSALEGNLKFSANNGTSYLNIETRYVNFNDGDTRNELSINLKPGIVFNHKNNRIGLEVGIGSNQALSKRPGGDREQLEASVFYDFPLLGGHFISEVSYTDTQDSSGYSPKLEFNEPRKTEFWSASAQYFYPISSDFIIHTSYYYRDQNSNIAIFKTKTESLDLGFTYRF